MRVIGIDHVQLAMPAGGEGVARAFYEGILGLEWVEKPAPLAARGGCWFECGPVRLHLGVDTDFRPARKAHPGLLVDDLAVLVEDPSLGVNYDEPIEGYTRAFVDDPFGNRLELLQLIPER